LNGQRQEYAARLEPKSAQTPLTDLNTRSIDRVAAVLRGSAVDITLVSP